MSSSLTHSFELPEVKEATMKLIADNADHLICYIYKNKTTAPYNTPLIRVGLVMKTLLKTDNTVKSETIEPVIHDLLSLISDAKDLRMTEIYQEELRFLKSCSILDDMITLNTQK
jgi:hypothetical protein